MTTEEKVKLLKHVDDFKIMLELATKDIGIEIWTEIRQKGEKRILDVFDTSYNKILSLTFEFQTCIVVQNNKGEHIKNISQVIDQIKEHEQVVS